MSGDGGQILRLVVEEADARRRLDAVLARCLPDVSRQRVQALIRDGHVRLGGRTIGDRNLRVKPGDLIEVDLPPPADPEPAGLRPETPGARREHEHPGLADLLGGGRVTGAADGAAPLGAARAGSDRGRDRGVSRRLPRLRR